jgi:CheY-like chemotaxis protein
VASAEGGYQGIAAWEEEGPFDLVLLDMHMPDLDGIETGKALRAMGGPAASVPVYLLTANPLQLDARVWREAGIDGCLGKPFRVEEVARLLANSDASAARPPEPALVALPDLLADLKDLGRDRMAGLVDLFRRTSAQDLDAAMAAAGASDLAQLALVVHRMASAAFSLHLIALAQHCRAIEDAARAERPDTLQMAENLPDLWKSSLAALGDVVSS